MTLGNSPVFGVLTQQPLQAYVSNYLSQSISIIDVTSNQVVGTIAIPANPRKFAVTPDGSFAYVAVRNPDGVLLIDLRYETPAGWVADPNSTFDGPERVALSPTTAVAYVTNFNAGTLFRSSISPRTP